MWKSVRHRNSILTSSWMKIVERKPKLMETMCTRMRKKEIWNTVIKMKIEKSEGPDEIPGEAWKCLDGEVYICVQ